MAQLYLKQEDNAQLGCYSERGLMSYFMFHVLPRRITEFLNEIVFSADAENPFAAPPGNLLEQLTIFSELGFGSEGFGNPDGAIWWFRLATANLI